MHGQRKEMKDKTQRYLCPQEWSVWNEMENNEF